MVKIIFSVIAALFLVSCKNIPVANEQKVINSDPYSQKQIYDITREIAFYRDRCASIENGRTFNLDMLYDSIKKRGYKDKYLNRLFVNMGGFSFKQWRGRVYQGRTGHGCEV